MCRCWPNGSTRETQHDEEARDKRCVPRRPGEGVCPASPSRCRHHCRDSHHWPRSTVRLPCGGGGGDADEETCSSLLACSTLFESDQAQSTDCPFRCSEQHTSKVAPHPPSRHHLLHYDRPTLDAQREREALREEPTHSSSASQHRGMGPCSTMSVYIHAK